MPPANPTANSPLLLAWRNRSVQRALPVIAVVAALLIAYAPVLRGGWLWDDDTEYTANLELRDPAGWWKAWVTPSGPDYFPLKTSVQWVQWHAWGEGSTLGYHLTCLGLHFASALLLWRVLSRLGVRFAWFGGLLFAVHPLAVESVAWLAELKNTLSLPLLLLSFDAWLDFDATKKGGAYARSLAWFVAALLAKTTVVMLPVFLAIYLIWRRGRITRRDLPSLAGFFAASAVLGLVTIWFQHHRAINGWEMEARTVAERLADAARAMVFYAGRAVWPGPLMPIYSRWGPAAGTATLLVLGATAIATVYAWRRRWRWTRHLVLGAAWFGLHLLPAVGLIDMAYWHIAPVADHFAYVSIAGAAGLLAAGWGSWAIEGRRLHRFALSATMLGAIIPLVWLSREHARHFADAESLWTYAVAANPHSSDAHRKLGDVRLAQQKWDAAAAEYRAALQIEPRDAPAHLNLSTALARLGRPEQALAEAREAVRLDPGLADAHYNLANLLSDAGELESAATEYAAALRVSSRSPIDVHYNFGNVLLRLGRPADALPHYREVLRLNPNFAPAHINLGNALAALDRLAEALPEFETAIRLVPDSADAHYCLADAFAMLGEWGRAIPHYQAALRGEGAENPELRIHLGGAWLQTGRFEEAAAEFEAALRIAPNSAEATAGLAAARARLPATRPETGR